MYELHYNFSKKKTKIVMEVWKAECEIQNFVLLAANQLLELGNSLLGTKIA